MSTRDARHQSLQELHERRKEVVRLHLAGHRVMEIVALTGLSWPSVRRALDSYLDGGEQALAPAARGKQSGDGRRLDATMTERLCTILRGQRPQDVGLDGLLWDRVNAAALVERETGVPLSARALGNYLQRWGFAPARVPMRRGSGMAPAFAQWLDTEWPGIASEARRRGAEVQWVAAVRLVDLEVDETDASARVAGLIRLAAVSSQGKSRWRIVAEPLAATDVIDVLEALAGEIGAPLRVLAAHEDLPLADASLQHWLTVESARVRLATHPRVHDGARSAPAEERATSRIDADPSPIAAPPTLHEPVVAANPMLDTASKHANVLDTASRLASAGSASPDRRSPTPPLGSQSAPRRGPHRGNSMRLRSVALAGVLAAVAAPFILLALREQPTEINPKPMLGDYWAHRVAYPTMHYSPSWYTDAKPQDAALRSAVPAGQGNTERAAQSPLALSGDSWTFLGPRPLLNSGYGIVSGRTNVIAVDPRGPDVDGLHTVFAASDGGGVWKSTNCCSATTTWRNVTDQPDIASIAIGELYIEPSNPDIIYAGTGDLRYGSFSFGAAGVLKSIDRGETWSVLGENVFTPFYPPSASLGFPQYQAVGKIVSSPHDAATLVVGTKTGLFVSNNGGVDWTGPCYTNTHASQRQDITGLVAQDIGGGQTSLLAAVGTRGNPTTVQPDLGNLGANGVYRATLPASGCPTVAAWTLLNSGWPAGTGDGNPAGKTLGRIELAVARTDPQVVYALGAHATASNVLGVWRSSNGGTTWTQTATSTSIQSGGCSSAGGGGSQMWYDAGLTVDPNNADTVLLSGVDVYRSKNGGVTFQDVTCGYGNGNVHVDQHARAYLPSGGGNYDSEKALVGGDGGVYYTANMGFGTGGSTAGNRPSFISLNQTIGSIELYSGDITGNFANAPSPGANAGAQDNGSSWVRWTNADPAPAQWTVRNGGDGIYTRIEPVNENRWYYSSQNGALVVSTSGPNSTPTAAAPDGWGGDTLSFVMPFEIYRHGALDAAGSGCTTALGCTYLIAGTTRVWETLTGAIPRTSWYANSPNLTKGTLGNRSFINQLSHATKTPSVAIAGTNDGNVQVGFGLNQGTANTATWINVTAANATLPNRPVMDVTIDVGSATDPAASAIGYAALGGFDQNTPTTPGHVYRLACSNQCTTFTWRNISGGLPNIPANAIAVNPNLPNQVFVGTDWGLYFTDDASVDNPVWNRFDNGLPRVMVWDLAIDRGFTTLAAFTRGRGAWAWPLPLVANDVIFRDGFDPPSP
jgi:transposase